MQSSQFCSTAQLVYIFPFCKPKKDKFRRPYNALRHMQSNFKWEPWTFLEEKLPLSPNWFAHKLAITGGQLSSELFKVWLKKAARINSSPTQRSWSPHWENKMLSSCEGTKVLKRESARTSTLVITNLVKLTHKNDSIPNSQGTHWKGFS